MSSVSYREYAPPSRFAESVECLWTVRSEGPVAEPVLNRVLPDGCWDLVLNLGDDPVRDGVPHHALRAYVVGPMTRALPVRHVGRVEFVGVRFLPGSGTGVFRVPAGELLDRAVALDDLAPRLASATGWIQDASDATAAVERVAAILPSVVTGQPPDRLAAIAWARLRSTGGGMPIRQLASHLGAAERRLQRVFHSHVGLTPKMAARVVRLRKGLDIMRRHADWTLARVALESGYYDQPHFNREFSRLTGITPQQWRVENVAFVQSEAAAPP